MRGKFLSRIFKDEYILSEIKSICPICSENVVQQTILITAQPLVMVRCTHCGGEYSNTDKNGFNFCIDYLKTKEELKRVANDTGNTAQILYNLDKLL